jgi:hypothetical protein
MAQSARRTDPELWEKVKEEITKGGKGGRKGEWSARKAQLAVAAYKKRGGGYQGGQSKDNSLRQWTEEDWGTRSGKKSIETGERYLPKAARKALSDDEYARTTRKKRQDTNKGRQFSAQPVDVRRETAKFRHDSRGDRTKAELYEEDKARGIKGRSKMSKAELADALGR